MKRYGLVAIRAFAFAAAWGGAHAAEVAGDAGSGAPGSPASAAASAVHLIWMGGNDCPPCKYWRAVELPKLQASPEFQRIHYTYVTKTIQSSVPPAFFLPDDIRQYKPVLDAASAGGPGSPQAALIVDGEVFDYFHGVRSATKIEKMLEAVRTGGRYPFKRCKKMSAQGRACEVRD